MKPGASCGALVGAMLAATFVAVSWLGWTGLGLPFLPFDLFDWITRALPGSVVTFGIETTLAIGRALAVASLGSAAKTLEQTVAIAGLVAAGSIGAALLSAVLRRLTEPALALSGVLGAMAGGLAVVIERELDRLAADRALDGLWVFATVFASVLAFGWIHDRLSGLGSELLSHPLVSRAARRRFLIQVGGSTFGTGLLAALTGVLLDGRGDSLAGSRWSDTHPLPNGETGVAPLAGTRPELTPLGRHYRVDTNTRAPRIASAEWRLRVSGLVQRPLAFTLGELRQWDPLHQFVTLSCISNPPGGDLISTTRWTGVSLRRFLQALVLKDEATHLRIVSADGFSESVAIAAVRADERIMLAYAWDGVPLPADHGFPLRLYVPDLYGMKQPKWVVGIEAVDRWEPGYWVARGWDRDGRVAVVSAIDVVRRVAGVSSPAVDLGGIAFAGSRGVSRVEVRVDDGDWQPAQLREPLSETAWVVWRARAAAPRGGRVCTVRAFDGQGRPQQTGFHARPLT